MNLRSFTDGLAILSRYFDNPNAYALGAEHDQFYVYKTDRPVTEPDVVALRELGWFQPEQESGEPYDPGEGWSCWV